MRSNQLFNSFSAWTVSYRRASFCCLMMLVSQFAMMSMAAAATTGTLGDAIPLKHHQWGKFDRGAWQLVRVTTETLDEAGKVTGTSTTEKRTTLLSTHRNSAKLKIKVKVEVGGRKYDAPDQTIVQGVHGESEGSGQVVKQLDDETTKIEGQEIPCQVQEYEITARDTKKIVKVYHSSNVAPYVLQRETTTVKGNGRRKTYRTKVKVVALDKPYDVLDQVQPTSLVETSQKDSKGTVVTKAVHCEEIPGSLVAFTSEETDAEGRVIRRSRMELVDFGLKPEKKGSASGRRSKRDRRRRDR